MTFLSEALLAVLDGIGGAYGALQSWFTRRKMRQVEEEMLAPKLDIDFRYDIVLGQEFNLLYGVFSFENKGTTNIKIIQLNLRGGPPMWACASKIKETSLILLHITLRSILNHYQSVQTL